jgi:hypothetical protein
MAAPQTREEFLELVRKSGVVDEKRLDTYLERTAGTLPEELGRLAGVLVRDAIVTYFQAEQFLQGKWRRFTIGKYKVLERLGSGGMGSVYLCEHKFMRRRVAVKVLPSAKAEESSALERFYREARAVAALDHPNIVRAYDIDQDDKLHFLVMEYIDGSSLQEIVKRHGPLDPIRAAHYVSQAAGALEHAYETAKLIHRDIKPGNILVDRAGTVKVLDMGLARFFEDDESNITGKYDENVLGTADYLAPEQALDSHNVDIRADIYSLGATFYFCLTGCTPFEGGTIAQKLIWHQTRRPKSVRAIRPEVLPELAAVVEKMMAKDPGQRFQTPAEVVTALARWTAQAIDPPPEREMPRLSPAALGWGAPAGDVHPSAAHGPLARLSGPASRKWEAAPRTPSPRPAASPPANGPEQAALGLNRSAAAQTPRPGPRAAKGATRGGAQAALPLPVEEPTRRDPKPGRLAPETDDIQAQLDTLPHSVLRRRPQRLRTLKAIPPLKTWQIIGLSLLGGAVLCGLVGWMIPSRRTADGPEGGTTWYVTRSDGPGSFLTVREALAKARGGDRIVVLDDHIEEPLILTDGQRGREVTVEAGNRSRRVRWACPPNPTEGRFICLANLQGFRLKGFVLDGKDQVQDLVVLSGPCAGLVLEDLCLQGFKRCGIAARNCCGRGETEPVTLRAVRTVSRRPEAEAGLSFQGDDKSGPAANQHWRVTDCRFEGPYSKAAVELASPLVGAEFRLNRFFNTESGLLYVKGTPRYRLQLILDSNTFSNLSKFALNFEGIPVTPGDSRVLVRNNLFAQTGGLAQVGELDRLADAGRVLISSGNYRDPGSKEGNFPLKAVETSVSLSTDAADDNTFLRYPRANPLSSAGEANQPVGVPPLDP